MRAQQGASEGESDTGFPFFISDARRAPDVRVRSMPCVCLIPEAYAAGNPESQATVSGVLPMFGCA